MRTRQVGERSSRLEAGDGHPQESDNAHLESTEGRFHRGLHRDVHECSVRRGSRGEFNCSASGTVTWLGKDCPGASPAALDLLGRSAAGLEGSFSQSPLSVPQSRNPLQSSLEVTAGMDAFHTETKDSG